MLFRSGAAAAVALASGVAGAWANEAAAAVASRVATSRDLVAVMISSSRAKGRDRCGSDSLERVRQVPGLQTQRRPAAEG